MEHLKDVLDGAVHAKPVEAVQITLPGEFIRTKARVRKGDSIVMEGGGSAATEGQWPEFLKKYEKEVEDALKKLERFIIDGNNASNEGKVPN